MDNHPSRRYYAVRIGRQGPCIYDNYAEFAAATLGFSGSSGKGFDNIYDAQDWLRGYQFGLLPSVTTNLIIVCSPANLANLTWLPFCLRIGLLDININLNVFSHANVSAETIVSQQVPPEDSVAGLNQDQEVSGEQAAANTVELSDEQKHVLKLVKSGQNIFFTGPAGTGKSVLLRAIIDYLRSVHGPNIGVTAPTGIAGLNIGGQTIHSWAGIGLGKEPLEKMKYHINSDATSRWTEARALVIDEVSMLDGRLFDKLEALARIVRKSYRPFGGIQLIVSGDFFQLPPVPEQDSTSKIKSLFAFQAESWQRCIEHKVKLTKVFRQTDNKFIEMLASMRTGVLEDWHKEEFRKLCRGVHYQDGISPTQLFPRKADVERHNLSCLEDLPGETILYTAMDARGYDIYGDRLTAEQAENLLEKHVCPKQVPLKVGAQVMLLRNMFQGVLVNGSLGKVVEFVGVHDAQARHIQMAEVGRKEGQESLFVDVPDAKEDVSGLIALDDHAFRRDQLWPLVKFTNGKSLLCSPVEFVVEGLKGNVEARRLQVPLALSWAMSIHKSQGQTLSRVKVDLARAFEKGQAYVAISRATCMEGLEIVNFDPVRVMAHPDVIAWQKQWDQDRRQEEEMDSDWVISQWYESFQEQASEGSLI